MNNKLTTNTARISASHAVFGLGIWQSVWMFVFAFGISAIYSSYAAVEFDQLSESLKQFLSYDARFIAASFFLRASICFLIALSNDTQLQRRTLIFWSFFNLIPLALVLRYANIFDTKHAFYIAAAIPCIEATILGYLGWIGCKPRR